MQAIEAVAGLPGNTRTVCRKSYIHPEVIDAYMDGTMFNAAHGRARAVRTRMHRLRRGEVMVLTILQQRAAKEAGPRRAA